MDQTGHNDYIISEKRVLLYFVILVLMIIARLRKLQMEKKFSSLFDQFFGEQATDTSFQFWLVHKNLGLQTRFKFYVQIQGVAEQKLLGSSWTAKVVWRNS